MHTSPRFGGRLRKSAEAKRGALMGGIGIAVLRSPVKARVVECMWHHATYDGPPEQKALSSKEVLAGLPLQDEMEPERSRLSAVNPPLSV